MVNLSQIQEHMEVIGADGVHVGTVDKLEGDRIKLTKSDSGQGSHQVHHHYLSVGLVADIEDEKVRLSANGANAFMFQEENDGSARLASDATDHETPRPYSTPALPPTTVKAGPDWAKIGVGAAAVSALAGAALFLRNKARSAYAFELRLQDDEDVRLISSSKVEGTAVVGRKGEHLGTIANFMVDKYTGRVAYAVLSFGGTMGIGGSLFPLPWSLLTYDVGKDGYVLAISKEQLANAPQFKASEAPEFSTSYRRDVALFYGGSRR